MRYFMFFFSKLQILEILCISHLGHISPSKRCHFPSTSYFPSVCVDGCPVAAILDGQLLTQLFGLSETELQDAATNK